ncbi:MAG: BamA/TamA family outer membrane protein [Candidatus Eisenbacteria bacterium]|uniref:BamA/TamA family outer membrane protein n=1 Tax=Eiseniibacteriota bacterium TaxID=2212470 RepID=A0A9D6L4K6_UNCEI|nr:BamA/TamA family outer membrane protein [Candidatus Eisenbacteria bacterium]
MTLARTIRSSVMLLIAVLLCAAVAPAAGAALLAAAAPETLEFTPKERDTGAVFARGPAVEDEEWMRAPFGEGLLTTREQWSGDRRRTELLVDYNRVDRLRLGVSGQMQVANAMAPRLGGRIEYAFGRERLLYGLQLEQPIAPPGRVAVGVSVVRRTDHLDLHQVDDAENTLALLLGHYDDRDYFEREGIGGYLTWRVPDFSTVSVHLRRDQYRSLPLDPRTRSWFHRSRPWRDNPAIDDGETRTLSLRLEHAARPGRHRHAGLYHWLDVEWADHGLGGDFQYVRMLGDVRSVMRLSPATTLNLRLVAGHTASGTLPRQKAFVTGGVDGLRAHPFDAFRGDQIALTQAEYSIGLWRRRHGSLRGGIAAIAFLDAGTAWSDPAHRWNLGDRHIATDGGVGLATAEDRLRVYLARDLQRSDGGIVLTVRFHRPF